MTPADKFYAERRSEPRPEPEPLEPSATFIALTLGTLVIAVLAVFAWVVALS